jgi:hypothetical protein
VSLFPFCFQVECLAFATAAAAARMSHQSGPTSQQGCRYHIIQMSLVIEMIRKNRTEQKIALQCSARPSSRLDPSPHLWIASLWASGSCQRPSRARAPPRRRRRRSQPAKSTTSRKIALARCRYVHVHLIQHCQYVLVEAEQSDTDDAWHVQTRMLSCVRLAKALYQRFTDQLAIFVSQMPGSLRLN